MKEIKNVFNGKSAFIVGELVACGCQALRAEELDQAAQTFEVSDSKLKEIKDALNSETNWDEAITHESYNVRIACVRQRVGLETLVNDKHWMVRFEVAKQGFGLDILVNDEDFDVRIAVANHGFGLETLVNDKVWAVRREVAKQGFGLDTLVNDKYWIVRAEAEKQLEMLTNI